MKEIIERSGLTAKEESIVRLHYGIDCPAHSIEEIAAIFDLPGDLIRRIEAAALRKLRQCWFSRQRVETQATSLVGGLIQSHSEEPWMAFTEPPVCWEMTDADRKFLRSCNICPE